MMLLKTSMSIILIIIIFLITKSYVEDTVHSLDQENKEHARNEEIVFLESDIRDTILVGIVEKLCEECEMR